MPPSTGRSWGNKTGGFGARGKGKGKSSPAQWNVLVPAKESPIEQERKSEELKAKMKKLGMTRQDGCNDKEGLNEPKTEAASSPQVSRETELELKAKELRERLVNSGIAARPMPVSSEPASSPSGPTNKPTSERAGGMAAQSNVLTVSQFAAQAATGSQSPAPKPAKRTLPESVDLTEGSSPNGNRPPWKAAPKNLGEVRPKQPAEGTQDLSMQEKLKSRAERFAKTAEASVPATGAPGSTTSSAGLPGTGGSSSARSEPAMGTPPSRPVLAPPAGAPPPRAALPGTEGPRGKGMGPARPPLRSPGPVGSAPSPRGANPSAPLNAPARPAAPLQAPQQVPPTRPVAPLQAPQQGVRAAMPGTSLDAPPTRAPAGSHETPAAGEQAPPPRPQTVGTPAHNPPANSTNATNATTGAAAVASTTPSVAPPGSASANQAPASTEKKAPLNPANTDTQKPVTPASTEKKTPLVPASIDKKAALVPASAEKKGPVVPASTDKKTSLAPTSTDKKAPVVPANTDMKTSLVPASTDKKTTLVPTSTDKKTSLVPASADKKAPLIPVSAQQKAPIAQPAQSGQAVKRPAPASKAAAPTTVVLARSGGLVKALAKFNEKHPPRKKPRLTEGEVDLWSEEYKRLSTWMEANLPQFPMYSKPGATKVMKYTNEKAEELEKYLRDVSAPAV